MQNIPLNIKYKICEFLDVCQLNNMLSICKSWRSLYHSDNFWCYLIFNRFENKHYDHPKEEYLTYLIRKISSNISDNIIKCVINAFNNVTIIECDLQTVLGYHHLIFNSNTKNIITDYTSYTTPVKLFIKENKMLVLCENFKITLIDTINCTIIKYKKHNVMVRSGLFVHNLFINNLFHGHYTYHENCIKFIDGVYVITLCLETLNIMISKN